MRAKTNGKTTRSCLIPDYGTRTPGSKQLGPLTALASQRKEPRFLQPQNERDKFEIYDGDDDQNVKDGDDDDNNDDDDG